MLFGYWIGLSDSASEGTWLWLNGNRANPDDGSLWHPGRPLTGSSGNNIDCAYAYFDHELFNEGLLGLEFGGLFVWDDPCSYYHLALCEKPV